MRFGACGARSPLGTRRGNPRRPRPPFSPSPRRCHQNLALLHGDDPTGDHRASPHLKEPRTMPAGGGWPRWGCVPPGCWVTRIGYCADRGWGMRSAYAAAGVSMLPGSGLRRSAREHSPCCQAVASRSTPCRRDVRSVPCFVRSPPRPGPPFRPLLRVRSGCRAGAPGGLPRGDVGVGARGRVRGHLTAGLVAGSPAGRARATR